MKLLVTAGSWPGELLADVKKEFPSVQFATITDRRDVLREIVDAEIVFGGISREEFLAAEKLKWIQHQGAGVERIAAISEITDGDVIVTNTRGAHAATIRIRNFCKCKNMLPRPSSRAAA